ncbi:unnamed protein product, partial [Allacma fusca]
MQELINILEPFADLTDVLQGDKITSSILIASLVTKLKALRAIETKNFVNLKSEILSGVRIRFSTMF